MQTDRSEKEREREREGEVKDKMRCNHTVADSYVIEVCGTDDRGGGSGGGVRLS